MFSRGIRLGKFFGTELYLHPFWFLLVLLVVFPRLLMGKFTEAIEASFFLVGLYGSVVAHEYAHIFVGRLYGIDTKKIVINFFGGAAMMDRIIFGLPEVFVGIAGPIFSACFGLGFLIPFLLGVPHDDFVLSFLFSLGQINLILAAFNMIPLPPMDGGRVLRGLLFHFTKKIVRATKITTIIGLVVFPVAFVLFIPFNFFTAIIFVLVVKMSFDELNHVKMFYTDNGDPNLIDINNVVRYIMAVPIFGAGSPEVNALKAQYSNTEFDIIANGIDAVWNNMTPEEKQSAQRQAISTLLSQGTDTKLMEMFNNKITHQ